MIQTSALTSYALQYSAQVGITADPAHQVLFHSYSIHYALSQQHIGFRQLTVSLVHRPLA